MPIDRVSVGSNLYLFQSPDAASNQCVIVAHSGRKPEDGGTHMPAGTSTRFYVPDGSENRGNVASSVALRREGRCVAETINPHEESWDYRLGKFREAKRLGPTYGNIKLEMEENARSGGPWQPHVVTIRNRIIGSRTMHLSDVIREVQQSHPHITEFHLAGCRQTRDGKGALPPLRQAREDQERAEREARERADLQSGVI
jgi:hypothetical protein